MNNKKVLNLFDVVLMMVTANFGVRFLAVSGAVGPKSIIFFILIAITFLIPIALMCAQMSKIHPDEGGIYSWVKHTLGEKSSFLVAWFYWVNNIFYYPTVLIFCISNFAYAIGHPELLHNVSFTTCAVLAAFWISVITSIFGLKITKYLIDLGGILGLIIPAIFFVTFSIFAYIKFGGSLTQFNTHTLIPQNKISENLFVIAALMSGMTGAEVSATFFCQFSKKC